jgi:Arc/MetJ family transcription regulator
MHIRETSIAFCPALRWREEKTAMRTRTTLNLDTELVRAAQEALGTTQITETIHRALEEAVHRRMRRRLAELPLTDLTPDRLEEMRRGRTFDVENQQVE